MTEETYTFEQARARLEEIAKQAKGASLEKCLDLLEEGVRLANVCTEKIDHTKWRDEVDDVAAEVEAQGADGAESLQATEDGTDSESGEDDDGSDAEDDAHEAQEADRATDDDARDAEDDERA
jgi:exodeoxyribonuclease VII small subunit